MFCCVACVMLRIACDAASYCRDAAISSINSETAEPLEPSSIPWATVASDGSG